MKRFYKMVSTEQSGDGYHILLDGRSVKTKSGQNLHAYNEAIANHIVEEWASQGDDIIPDTMPFTQILNTKQDRVSQERDAMCVSVLKYLDTDLICYFADDPQALIDLQKEQWQPILDWFEQEFSVVLKTTSSLVAVTQPDEAHKVVQDYVESLEDEHFTILQLVTSVSGSLLLALAFMHGAIDAQGVFDACYVEETYKNTLYNAEKYGVDPMLEKTQQSVMADLSAAQDYLQALS